MTRPASDFARDVALERRVVELEAQLREAEETLEAIRSGEVDAVIVGHSDERRVYTIETADRPYRVLIEQMQEGAVTFAEDGTVLYCNRRLAEILRTPQERVTAGSILSFVPDTEQDAFARLIRDSANGGGKGEFNLELGRGLELGPDASVPVYVSLVDLPGEGQRVLCGIVTDLTQQKERVSALSEANAKLAAEMAERARTEDQLRQAQKMEAVGQLTGGLAHDFNNLLTVILGNLERAGARVADEAIALQIGHARQAAERGASLTRQLLAFSRTQSLRSQAICVNELLPGLEMLIRRAVGEDIQLAFVEGEGLWHCEADPNQLESALLNLAINARDAMPSGGVLTIETANVKLGEGDAHGNAELMPGRYVAVSVSDTGTGITPEVLAQVFQPFFTTKEVGKGSGLGLSMVYGFARQSGGHVAVDSEVGRGTSVRIYLPWAEEAAAEETTAADGRARIPEPASATEPALVLVVEDDPHVRPLAVQLVADLGHTVLEAETGPQALEVIDRHPQVDLLFTDVVMPKGMSGIDLAREARRRMPDIAVLLTSGYTAQSLAQDGSTGTEFRIIHKPYTREMLGDGIEAALAEIRTSPTQRMVASVPGSRVLVVEDDGLIAMMLEDILHDLGHRPTGTISEVAKALVAVDEGGFDVALLDVSIGREPVFPVADKLLAKGVPFAFMTGHDSASLPTPYRDVPSLPKPYSQSDVQRVLAALLTPTA